MLDQGILTVVLLVSLGILFGVLGRVYCMLLLKMTSRRPKFINYFAVLIGYLLFGAMIVAAPFGLIWALERFAPKLYEDGWYWLLLFAFVVEIGGVAYSTKRYRTEMIQAGYWRR